MPSFSERLKELRKSKKMTQKQVALETGVSESHYQYYEYGKNEPSIGKLIVFCNYFNVSADYLLGLSETKERQP